MTQEPTLYEIINLEIDEQKRQSEYIEQPAAIDENAHIALRTSRNGTYLIINGIDMSNITSAVRFELDADRAPRIWVQFITGTQLDIIADDAQLRLFDKKG